MTRNDGWSKMVIYTFLIYRRILLRYECVLWLNNKISCVHKLDNERKYFNYSKNIYYFIPYSYTQGLITRYYKLRLFILRILLFNYTKVAARGIPTLPILYV